MINKTQNRRITNTKWGTDFAKSLYIMNPSYGEYIPMLNCLWVQIDSSKTTTVRIAFWRRDD